MAAQYTHPLESLFTQIKIGFFGGMFLSFRSSPRRSTSSWRRAFTRTSGTPSCLSDRNPGVLSARCAGRTFRAMPLLMRFSAGPAWWPAAKDWPRSAGRVKISEYLDLIMQLIFAFRDHLQLPVVLTLLARAGIIDSKFLIEKRRYAIVIVFIIAAILTPPV